MSPVFLLLEWGIYDQNQLPRKGTETWAVAFLEWSNSVAEIKTNFPVRGRKR